MSLNQEAELLALRAWKFEITEAIEDFDRALEPFYRDDGDLSVIAGYKAPVHGTTLWHRVLGILRANAGDLVGAKATEITKPWVK